MNMFSRFLFSLVIISAVITGFRLADHFSNIHKQAKAYEAYQQKENEFKKVNFNHDYNWLEMVKISETKNGQLYKIVSAEDLPNVFINREKVIKYGLEGVKMNQKAIGIFDDMELLDAWQVVNKP